MPKKKGKKKGGDFDDYDDLLAEPTVPTAAEGDAGEEEFAGVAKKKSKKKSKSKGMADDDESEDGDAGAVGGAAGAAVPTYSFGDSKKKSRSKVVLRRRTRAAEFYEGLLDSGPSPEELAAAQEAAAAKVAQEARLARLRSASKEFGKAKRRAAKYGSLEAFRAALAADLAAEEENPGLQLADKPKRSKKAKHEEALVVAARVESVEPHPGSDKLFVVTLDAGGAAAGCVTNVATLQQGDMVVLGHAGAVLPDGTVLAKAKVKGVESRGMICSPKNLGLGDEEKVPFDASSYTPGTTLTDIVQAEVGEQAEDAAEGEFGEKKKKKKKKKGFEDDDGAEDADDGGGASEFGAKKKKKKKKKGDDFEDEVDEELLMLIGEKEAPSEDAALEGDIEGIEALTMGASDMSEEEKKALKKKMLFMKKMVAEAEQEDTAKFGENKVIDDAPKKKLTAKQKRALKKQKEDEELERMLAGIDGDAPEPAAEPAAADSAPTEAKPDTAAKDADEAESGKPMTAAQKKKAKKKRQEAEKKAAAAGKTTGQSGGGGSADGDAGADDEAPERLTMEFIKTKPKRVQKILLEKLAVQEEEERLKQLEAEEQAKWEAEQKAQELAEAEAQMKREEKKKKRKEKLEADRKAGVAVTKKQKDDQARAQRFKEQMDEQRLEREAEKKFREEMAAIQAEQSGDDSESADEDGDAAEPEQAPEPELEPEPEPEPVAALEPEIEENWDDDSDDDDEDQDDDDDDDEDEDDSESDDSDDSMTPDERRIEKARLIREAELAEALAGRSPDNLRSPICCVLGHVDTGKTKVLDKIRSTNVQDNEAGGITQQIGATFFPIENLKKETMKIPRAQKVDHKIPGMLVIDTPGHESFSNLRTRGSGLCDIAILVVDIMHGLEPQTIESINLLKMRKTPFIVALNKVDRCYDWTTCPNMPIRQALKEQKDQTRQEFEDRMAKTLVLFAEQEINAIEYWKNEDLSDYVSVVPTSAISGEGIPDLLLLLVEYTQTLCLNSVMYHPVVECTVLEVKVIEGHGTTIDVVLVNGQLREKDTIVVCGMNGAIVTQVRSLLTPQPMKELRVKNQYMHHDIIRGAQGIKIAAPGLEEAIAGSTLMVCRPQDDLDEIKEEIEGDLEDMLSNIEKTGRGVYVQASTLGSLEALLEFLRTSKIPVSGISIGPVHRKDVVKASAQLEFRAMYAAIMAFDVPVDSEARAMAEKVGVKIFTADIIYHLFDQFTAYLEELHEKAKVEAAEKVVFPCRLKIMPDFVINRKAPIIMGVEVLDGQLKMGTPICVPSKEFLTLGRIGSIELDRKPVDSAKRGQQVAIRITPTSFTQNQFQVGRQFDENDELVSKLTRESIDLLKEFHRDDMEKKDWLLVIKLKKQLGIM